jgi:aldose 1-epimerase
LLKFDFGRTRDGRVVTGYRLENARGAAATILDYGCTVQALHVQSLCARDATGALVDVVLGYDTVGEYEDNDGCAGAVIGRFANRIGGSSFTLGGSTYRLARNDGENHLHGGLKGFDKVIWHAEEQGDTLVFTRLSPDGEENYPGNLSVRVAYTLTGDNALRLVYDADTDADTVVNLTNHSYFNLNGKGSVLGHSLQVFAGAVTENDAHCLPTGRLLETAGTPFDFGEPKQIGKEINAPDIQLKNGGGYDHNFVLAGGDWSRETAALTKAAALYSPESGIRMTVLTTEPGLQVYSGNGLTLRKGKNGAFFGRRDGLCLETQVWPNAMTFPHFPSPVLRKGEHYHSETVYRFDVLEETRK